MALLLGRSVDDALLTLIEDSGRNVQRTCRLLADMLGDYPEQAPLAADILRCEHEGDRITHDVIHWIGGMRRMRAPFDAGDGFPDHAPGRAPGAVGSPGGRLGASTRRRDYPSPACTARSPTSRPSCSGWCRAWPSRFRSRASDTA